MMLDATFTELHEEMVAEFGEISVLHGKDGKDGVDGAPGKDGVDGRTPVKGVDYWTDADKAEIIAAVIASLPVYGGETA
jgi:hypothetical protein